MPIVPAVSGIVVEVPVTPNEEVEKGAVLFQIDPKPYELEVQRIEAKLVDAQHAVKETGSTLGGAEAAVEKAIADRDRSKKAYERAAEAGAKVLPQDEIDNKRQLYLADEAVLEAARADYLQIQQSLASQIDGVDTRVLEIRADEDLNALGIPIGVQGRAAVYTEQDALHSSPVRRILLRMMGWLNYLYPIKS